jgi:mRNA interferase MazF
MPPTTGYSFGDVVLVPFPFTDQSASKKRPAVVISSSGYHRAGPDLLIMAITSQVRASRAFGEHRVKDWQSAGLLKPSAIKPVVTTIERKLVLRRLGQLADEDQQALRNAIAAIIG